MSADRAEGPPEGERTGACRPSELAAVREALGRLQAQLGQREEEIRRLEDVARLAEEAPIPVMRAAGDGRLVYANEASAPLLDRWRCAVGGSLPEAWVERVLCALAEGEPTMVEAAVGERDMALMLTPVPAHNEVNLYAMDVTELGRAEEALRQSEAHFRRAFEQAPIGIALVDTVGMLIEVNLAMVDLVGYPRQELLRQSWHDLIHPDDLAEERRLLEQVVSGRESSYRVEERLVTSDGAVLWAIVDGALLRTAAAEPMYLVLQVQDITERRLADELALRVAVEEAEERERRRVAQELHDRVGQELSALGISLGLLQIQAQGRLEPAGEARLSDALALVREITASVRTVMAELRPPMLDEYGLLAALRWYGGVFAGRMGVSVRVMGREPLPRLPSNVAIMLFRIAQEALSNVARHADATRVEIRLMQRGDTLRLTVADNGRGFDPTTVRTPTPERGWGVRTMAERATAIGGQLDIEARPGGGTRVVVTVPWPPGVDALDAVAAHR